MDFDRLGPLPFGGLSRHELLRGAANRLLYSKFYTYYYGAMFILGLVSLITAFIESCPSVFFIIIESTLCICMMMEIITRGIAMQRSFFSSWWNYFDILIVLFCAITLILLSRGCSASSNSEELLNTMLLVVRNAAQIFRLLATLRKNRRQIDAREMNVDLNNGDEFLDIINDMDNFMDEPEFQIQRDGQQSRDSEFRLSIDSFGHQSGPDNDNSRGNGGIASVGFRRSDSRSSATSIHSATDRLTGRKK
ncbi:hypothetical protein LPJ78_000429 [Coemansia sp. RSA 989]|nr:hypothetical protein LPJ68_000173 [Coemansia sp. RSA 1086]KAJ1753257.1 hypothetical protein LPJ79_000536 [Coemansia sp. RSA 1821]KAJ1868129.1 hypothetical protein LPJ78_000429 [Coemansia sp. RSA 989]KAJ1875065.1 hypothetical protein LPJ55_001003 [Coemansia sp. RSA 990]KAJ2653439.1 hypothetical protein IWW40_000493 [Coemansia sp. RSA 1250]KAJ2676367.1 hypothetical protein IWW42_000656 [Coemansia sp. RSA 1085]